jgi:demethylmenaquinone methyltransferase/2-methoxy-6-polyprenyl-1,4-benzoquinol methylase
MSETPQPGTATSFGFRSVDESERQSLVNRVFATVAERYDLMNDLMSGGLHRLWKNDLIAQLNPPRNDQAFRLLDVAGGTADVTLRYARASGPNATAMLCDISPEMIAVGKRRVHEAGLDDRIAFTEGNAEALPFADRAFDAYTIAFGIRNVPRIEIALHEAFRVLKTGGRFLCLEFSRVDVPGLDTLYDAFSEHVIPPLGRIVTGDEQPYRYLVESIRQFPAPAEVSAMLSRAGFARVTHTPLSGNIAALHGAWKL